MNSHIGGLALMLRGPQYAEGFVIPEAFFLYDFDLNRAPLAAPKPCNAFGGRSVNRGRRVLYELSTFTPVVLDYYQV